MIITQDLEWVKEYFMEDRSLKLFTAFIIKG